MGCADYEDRHSALNQASISARAKTNVTPEARTRRKRRRKIIPNRSGLSSSLYNVYRQWQEGQ
jgi:hypothetical protein